MHKMKLKDVVFFSILIGIFIPFFISNDIYHYYCKLNQEHGMLLSFVKFAVLATTGEILGLRIKTGNYNAPGFGILPRAIVWGLLGFTIKFAFVIFGKGTPAFLEYMGLQGAAASMAATEITLIKVICAFSISASMNLIYAPLLMTLHKITDTHIEQNKGSFLALVRPIPMKQIFINLNWGVQWNFVFKKTIPLFWIPAHTITFLLPEQFQVLFAALLGIALGVILAIAAVMSKEKK